MRWSDALRWSAWSEATWAPLTLEPPAPTPGDELKWRWSQLEDHVTLTWLPFVSRFYGLRSIEYRVLTAPLVSGSSSAWRVVDTLVGGDTVAAEGFQDGQGGLKSVLLQSGRFEECPGVFFYGLSV